MASSWGHEIKVQPYAGACSLCWPAIRRGEPETLAHRGAYESSYQYVTGRRGRVSTNDRTLCKKHAEAFAKEHGLQLPPEADFHVHSCHADPAVYKWHNWECRDKNCELPGRTNCALHSQAVSA